MTAKRIALTGGIATGKSYVLSRFAAAGIPTLDADVLAREAVAPGSEGLAAVVRRFGTGILNSSGGLDRGALASIVFNDATARRDLEAIVHPSVRAATDAWFAGLDPAHPRFAVVAIPLLFETGRERDFDVVVVTNCPPDVQLQRLISRDGLNEDEARRRIAAQWPVADKVRRADHVVETGGTFEETDRQVESLIGGFF